MAEGLLIEASVAQRGEKKSDIIAVQLAVAYDLTVNVNAGGGLETPSGVRRDESIQILHARALAP